jgi:multidrug efflux pump subunit AcrA (membrane-fusion protein)
MHRFLLYLSYAALGAAAFLTTGCAKHEAVAAAKESTAVRAYVVRPAAVASERRYAGSIEPVAQVTLAFRAPGAVEAIHQVRGIDGRVRAIETGDCVAAGTVLARIRTTEFRARTDAAQAQIGDAQAARQAANAQVEEAQAVLTQAELDWSRAQKLMAGEAMTKAEADGVKARVEAARSRAEAARAQVRALDARVESATAAAAESRVGLSDTSVAAPFPACVVLRQVERGAYAQPGTPAFVLADLSRVKVVFQIPDSELAQFRPGTRVQASVEAAGVSEVAATVQSVSPAADPVTRNFRVEAIAANPGLKLSAGLIASVTLPGSVSQGEAKITVPLSAVVRANADGTEFAVFAIHGQQVKRRKVELGSTQGNEVVVVSGLAANQRVVRDGVARLKDGETVKVLE